MNLKLPEDEVSKAQFLEARELALKIEHAGFPTYIVGGAVRDCLLGIPSPDVDLCTACPAIEIIRIIPEAISWGPQKYSIFRVANEKGNIEIARFREERECDGRHCEVELTDSFESDVRRRDFTINALAVYPETLEIIDFVGGVADLSSKTLRAVGKPYLRYSEDHLRMLRAVRFSARLGFSLSSEDYEAIAELAPVLELSADRIRHELEGILACPRPGAGLELLLRLGLWEKILGKPANPEKKLWLERFIILDRAASIGLKMTGLWALILAPLNLYDQEFDKQASENLKLFNFSNSIRCELEEIFYGLRSALSFKNLSKADAVALADSRQLPIISQIVRLTTNDNEFETLLARRFPAIGSNSYLRGADLAATIEGIERSRLNEALKTLRHAELSGEVRSSSDAVALLNSFK